ncbi:hypothetical protein ACGF1Z_32540 [Streptomyces sp. NPDC048018]|uniref:hypothetical protein n=1 Tax=Streptomyces sp. NPDC048018 TaxID=3365499 RepID=UPI00371CBBD2
MTDKRAPLSPPLAAALRRVEQVFRGMTASSRGCLHCFGAGELALLAAPGTRLDDDLLIRFFHKVPDHFEDHPAVVRRLLPQFLAYAASGEFTGAGFAPTGLGRTAWQEWPREQAEAIDAFLSVWWAETLAVPGPVPGVQAVFELCHDMRRSVTPLLDHWAGRDAGGAAERHLATWVGQWNEDLLRDDASSLSWWAPDPTEELQTWLVRHAAHLDRRVPLLALPPEARWVAYAEMVAEGVPFTAADTS